jgi:secretion/DNA translocation related TadE-like protein
VNRGSPGEEGAGSILVVGIAATIIAIVFLLLPFSAALVAKDRASGAADAAALAAADVAVGIRPGSPCTAAAVTAEANGAAVTRCEVDGAIVTVQVAISAAGLSVRAIATAGPPDARTGSRGPAP